jgi:hypothetical protein
MGSILQQLEDAARGFFIDLIMTNLDGMLNNVNEAIGSIAGQVGQTPQGWNLDIFTMIRNLSQTVIIPIAGLVITYVLCYELIIMITERNNMRDFDTFQFYIWIFKAGVAAWLVAHTFDIALAIFDVAQHLVNESAAFILGTEIDMSAALAGMRASLELMPLPELIAVWIEIMLIGLTMHIVSLMVTVILYGRMIEIYITCSVAPIPFATLANREWGGIGNNYIRGLLALAFQGFFIMVVVAIYTVLIRSVVISHNIHLTTLSIAGYTYLLVLSLMRTGSISRSIFNTH